MNGEIYLAKKTISIKFSKATLTKEDGKYTITEIIKDESKDYDLSEILDGLDGSSDLSISISSEDTVEPISEE
jgi:hypothetical protein